MLTTRLKLHLSTRRRRKTEALFVPGEDVRSWLGEISSWPVEHGDLKLIVVPRSKKDLRPRGVLVFGACIADAVGFTSANVFKFSCRAERLFVPANGLLYPEVDDAILEKELPIDSHCVWHPTGGLTTVSDLEILRVADLLSPSSRETINLNAAQPGIAFNSKLHSLTMLQPPDLSVEEILDDGRGDIGDEATDLSKLKPLSDERKLSTKSRALDSLKRPFAHLARKLTSMVPRSGNRRTWINGVEDWANGLLGQMSQRQQQRQFLDVYRLQEMLDKDPDEGLKFAMPLSNMFSSGVSSSASWLSKSLVNFNLLNLGGGGVGGPALPADLHSQLMRRYRELAEREIRLGRYRRAAYIYGNLLFDFSSAARTLETGKHFREAAILYREKLHRSDDAARCLKEGGFFSEAIELYESQKQFETAGDLYAQLGLDDSAKESWQTATDHFRTTGKLIDAARVEETKLCDDEQALQTLASAWPSSYQVARCLEQTFRILARNGQHQSTRTWIAKAESEAASTNAFTDLVELISKTASKYPDQSTRAFAIDATYRIVSKAIADDTGWTSPLLKAVAALHPSDKLLRRDCTRYQPEKKKTSTSKTLTVNKQGRLKELTLIAAHQLSDEYQWENATGLRRGFLVVGEQDKQIFINRLSSDFKGEIEHASRIADDLITQQTLIAINSSRQSGIVHRAFDSTFPSHLFSVTDRFSDAPNIRPVNFESNVIAICEGPHSHWQTLRLFDGQLLLECIDQAGTLVSSREVECREDDGREQHVYPPMHCDGSNTFITMGGSLIQLSSQGTKVHDFGSFIVSIAGSVRGVATRIAVGLEEGLRVLWLDTETEISTRICHDMSSPQLLFTQAGHLVVASGRRCEVFHTRRKEVQLVGRLSIPECVTLFRMDDAAQFGMLTKDGRLMVYQITV